MNLLWFYNVLNLDHYQQENKENTIRHNGKPKINLDTQRKTKKSTENQENNEHIAQTHQKNKTKRQLLYNWCNAGRRLRQTPTRRSGVRRVSPAVIATTRCTRVCVETDVCVWGDLCGPIQDFGVVSKRFWAWASLHPPKGCWGNHVVCGKSHVCKHT